ncbi:MAG TPA: PH domain-containing protein [Muribaculum sp.]|jgi:hypothetical protein|uniref:PH domain-containing protein n=1 Tax=Heminiphilus faecis TaxID=2601703 RepID=A0ABV4CTP2_9BACT|nr:PH domain-containing protein [Heminiphilus faecis]RLT75523.1 hypothetical protein D7V95_13310 [bacterium J10(2018)]HRF68906.1 PH domain-containing protein [Muribaculum sp.]
MKTVYRSRIDWWIWATACFFFVVLIVAAIGGIGLISFLIFLIGFGSIFAITFFGVWYAVEGNELSVYQFCRPHRFPINKIKAIKSCKSFLWGPALSSDKLAITFTDRSVLKLSGPMYISPKDKERFVGQLLEINPDIKINL